MNMIVQALKIVTQPSPVIIFNTQGSVGAAVAYLQSIDYVSDAGVVPEGCRVVFADLGHGEAFSIAAPCDNGSGWIIKKFFKAQQNNDFSIKVSAHV